MDFLSRFLIACEDLREVPHFARIGRSLWRAKRGKLRTCGYVIREQAERIPDRVLLRFEEETVTYGEYNSRVNRFANLLARAGVARGDVVAVLMENSPALLAAQGAVAKLGAVGALVNTQMRGAALRHVLDASAARVALGGTGCLPALRGLGSLDAFTVYAEGDAEELREAAFRPLAAALDEAGDAEPDIPNVGISDVFLYIYTSGTTGYPKPALIRHSRFTMGGESLKLLLDLRPGDCTYAPIPLYHGYANFVGFATALHNGSAFASRRRFSATQFLEDVRRHGATHFVYVGELCRYLLRRPPTPRDREHRIRVATGAGLRPDIWGAFTERFGIPRVVEIYGQTEANISLMNRRGRPCSVGRPAPFTHRQIRLVRFDFAREVPQRDARGRLVECGPGEVGELISEVSSRAMIGFDGYVNKEDTEAKLLRDCFRPGDLYVRTGDLLRRDRTGYYYFVDRVGDTFRWKGENVATMEVAETLDRAPGVSEAAVYGVKVPGTDGRAGMALLVCANGECFDPRAFYDHVERELPGYARPLFVRLAAAMDVTATLKHAKRRLQDDGYDPERIDDALYFLDAEARNYVPLDAALKRRIDAGELCL